MKYDGLIFDLDGTLWDASAASAIGWNNAFLELGMPNRVTDDDMRSVAGKPCDECLAHLIPGIENYDFVNSVIDNHESDAVYSRGGVLYDGVIEGIEALSKKYRVFLISNCQKWYLQRFLEITKLDTLLTGYDCHGASGVSKKEMIAAMTAAHALVNPVYIGDTASDHLSSREACVDFVHAGYGFGDAAGDCLSFDKFTGVVEYFLGQ